MFSILRTGLDAANKDLAVISNNIANAGTNGFKKVKPNLRICIIHITIDLKKLQEELV